MLRAHPVLVGSPTVVRPMRDVGHIIDIDNGSDRNSVFGADQLRVDDIGNRGSRRSGEFNPLPNNSIDPDHHLLKINFLSRINGVIGKTKNRIRHGLTLLKSVMHYACAIRDSTGTYAVRWGFGTDPD